jgi:hypothetical protein
LKELTMSMNREELQRAVSELEAAQSFPHRRALWQALAETSWARARRLTPDALRSRAARLGIRIATPPAAHRLDATPQGVVGEAARRADGPPGDSSGPPVRASSGRHRKKRPSVPLHALRAEVPAKFRHLVGRVEAGSLPAAVHLKCLECSAWQPAEIRLCAVTGCPLYHWRPHQP